MGAFFTTTLPDFFTQGTDEITDLITGNWVFWLLAALAFASAMACASGCVATVMYRPRIGPKFADTPAGRFQAMQQQP
jgi:hypothetical protein